MIIRTKFLLVFFATAVLPLLILASFLYGTARTAVTQKVEENIKTITTFKKTRSAIVINSYTEQAKLASTNPTLLGLVDAYNKANSPQIQQQLNAQLEDIQTTLAEVSTASIANSKHQIIASTNPALIGSAARIQTNTADFVLNNNDPPSASVQEPLLINGYHIGYLQLLDNGAQLASLTQDYTSLGNTGDILFMRQNPDGSVVISSSRFKLNDPQQTRLRAQLLMPQILRSLTAHSSESGTISSSQGTFFFSLSYSANLQASILTKVDTVEAFQSITQLRDSVLVFLLIFVLLITMLILFFVHNLTGPVANLLAVAQKITAGNMNDRALVLSRDEIGNLAVVFNHMLDELEASRNTLEQRVHERTQQLETANQELESFSYSVSHDLRAPLRAIDGFSNILAEDYTNKLDDDGKRVIATIRKSAQQMGRLIDDLLAFSRMGRQAVKKQEVDMASLAREVYEEQIVLNPNRNIDLRIGDLPIAYVDATLIRQVWVNLLSNAIKFTRQKSPAIIEVGAKVGQNEITYYVKDNGAGFNVAYSNKLFGVFQRLHDQKEFEGTGVGLAIVKRVVERNDGKVWAEAAVGQGATIYFSLPVINKDNKEPT